jgi:beta-glucosidase
MNNLLKISLKVVLAVLGLMLVLAISVGIYFNRNIINSGPRVKDNYPDIKELSSNGYAFRDLNRNGKLDVYEDARESLENRAEDLLSQMTLEEKISILKGSGMKSGMGLGPSDEGVRGAVGTIVPIPRLGIPSLYLSDGPAGLRIHPTRKNDDHTYYCTAFPIATLLASTWNVDLIEEVGEAMGREALEYGIDVILAPGANIHRSPLCGRNFEYYSEDPVLTGEIGAAMVNGIQSNGVGTSVKHFVANNQETNRFINDSRVSERAFREIYLKGFEIIVKKSQPWTLMSSYNQVNGTYTSESRYILTDILRENWGFEGIVMTDWFGGKHPPAQIHAGNDLLEPGTRRQYKALKKAAGSGELSGEDINTSAGRILKLVLNSRKMEPYPYSNQPDLEAHARVTRQSASEGMVLLKNEETLPLKDVKNIALFGVTSYDFITGGTGSGDVNEAYTVSLEEGLSNAGLDINVQAKELFEAHKASHAAAFQKPEGTLAAMTQPYSPPEMVPSLSEVAQVAGKADLAIVTLGRNSGEGGDRVETDDFLLSEDEQNLLRNVSDSFHAAGKKVVVVMNIGGVIETASWKDRPDAILLAWQGGQEGGNSVADILIGKVNPSGKLPMTFPLALADHASSANFPLEGASFRLTAMMSKKEKPEEEQVANLDYTNYEEGIYVGYRHFDKDDLEVSYPFGYGLSYTEFAYHNLELELMDGRLHIQLEVENTGSVPGKEVVEMYVSKPDTQIDRPLQELKAFAKTPLLEAGERVQVQLVIPLADLSYWNEEHSGWALEEGGYILHAGSSSRNIRQSIAFAL